MIKLEFKESTAVLLVIIAILMGIAIIGTNPLSTSNALDKWSRGALAGLGLIFMVILFILQRGSSKTNNPNPTNPEYEKRFQEAQVKFSEITPENKILAEASVGKAKFDVINDNILDSRSDIIVSSDDNHLTARGGVAKAILGKAGSDVAEELSRYRRKPIRQGQIVITTAGHWDCRAIIHPAVIDLDENRYPTTDVIKIIVRRSLTCALAIGARSISFPVLGGGTASKYLKPSDSVRAIVDEIMVFLNERQRDEESFTHIALYIYDKNDAAGLARNLAETAPNNSFNPTPR